MTKKKFFYIICVISLALGMSYSVYQYFTPMLKVTDQSLQISVLQDFWQFLLLGFVIGGVFFTIPGNNPRIHIAASLCIIATCLFLVFLGLTIAAAPWFRHITMIGMQLGLTAFYSGIAIVMIELIAYLRHAIVKEIRAR